MNTKLHRNRDLGVRMAIAAVASAILLFAVTVPVTAEPNQGTIKVHDDAVAEPSQRNEPHVMCDFWVEGFDMERDNGTLVFQDWPPTGDGAVVTPTGDDLTWTANETGHFLNGAYQLPPGHYKVTSKSIDSKDKSKVFWVDPCDETPETPPEVLACPDDLTVHTDANGGWTLNWTPAMWSDGSHVYRAESDGMFEYLATVSPPGFYHDTDVAVNASPTYTVTALFGDRESTNCDEVVAFQDETPPTNITDPPETTEIPFFPSAAALTIGAIGALGGSFLAMRRKKN